MVKRANIFIERRQQLRQQAGGSEYHHHVYVVLLMPGVAALRKVRQENPKRRLDKPCVYVGMTGLAPDERFVNHKRGKQSARVVREFGIRLLPELYAHLNPMPYEAAVVMEQELA